VSCGTCTGGLKSLTLRFNGPSITGLVVASDQMGIVYSNLVSIGSTITFNGSIPNQKFAGPNVTILVDALPNAIISSACSGFTVGDTYGSFTVLAASSQAGGPVCCPVALIDTTLPVISNCPVSFTQNLGASCTIPVSWTPPTAMDDCAIQNFTSNKIPGSSFGLGTTNVTYTATDTYGNVATCSFNVTVVDNTSPTFTSCPTNINLSAAANCKAIATWTTPTATDNCSVSVAGSHASGTEFPLGTTTVTYTATDGAGLTATCSFNVIVTDATPPTFTSCPANINLSAAANCKAIATWTTPTATDNCSVSVAGSHTSGTEFPLGTTTVTYTATDGAGLTATCTFNVVVTDTTPPAFTSCPTNINLSAAANCKAIATWVTPTATDNCSVSVSGTHASGTEFPLGTTTVTYTATDGAGLTATCTFNVIVTDTTPPTFTSCPTNINLSAAANCKVIATWTVPTATDNCSVSVAGSHASGTEFPLGTTTVTYTATDGSGLTATCTFNLIVTDTTPPTFTSCPTNINLSATANCKAIATWTTPTATDNCSVSVSGSHASGTEFPLGTTTVTYTATDGAGLTATCTFNVIVTDTTPPTFTSCPTTITLSASANCKAIATWTTPTATDNCSVSVAGSHTSGTEFPLGTTTVTYTATDGAGLTATCTFDVVVTDTTPPTFTSCPTNINLSAAANCKAIASWTTPTATDQCGAITISGSHTSGSEFDAGTTVVTYTATDSFGNTTTCSFDVVVIPAQSLQVSNCPEDIVIVADESDTALVTWGEPIFSLECGILTIRSSNIPDSRFAVGNTKVIYTASDGLGNSIECSFNVTVTEPSLDLEISKLITPDGDGFNDVWLITNLDKYPDNSVTVFDRWGSVIFRSDSYNNIDRVWRGENKSGATVPTGTYFFSIEVSYGRYKVKREGFIEVVQ
jgi:gliding motility-associated-like protein